TIRSISIVAFDKHHFDLGRVPMSQDSSAVKAGREWLSVATVVEQIFMKRHPHAHQRTAFDLTSGGKRIHDPSAVVNSEILENTGMAEFRIDFDFDEVRGESGSYLAVQCGIR